MKRTPADKILVRRFWSVLSSGGPRKLRKAVFGTKKHPTKKALTLMGLFDNQRKHMEINFGPLDMKKIGEVMMVHLVAKLMPPPVLIDCEGRLTPALHFIGESKDGGQQSDT